MHSITFLVQGSQDEPYTVVFSRNGSSLSASCSCPAGENGMYCKHRISILSACTDNIVSGNIKDVSTVCSWLPGSGVATAMQTLTAIEAEYEKIKEELSAAKKKLALAMRG